MGLTTTMEDADARLALKDELARIGCRVAQPDDPPFFTREPKSATHTVHWKWVDLKPMLERIGTELDMGAGGQRRTLRLANPGLPFGTTHTFWGSIQVIMPGEVAAAHRHTANAFRFIMQGNGATTTVEGERYEMNQGDLVLTPGMLWHDHEYQGTEPMIWLDVLDISLMNAMHATFFEPYRGEQQPLAAIPDRSLRTYGSALMRPPGKEGAGVHHNPLLVYPRAMAHDALDMAAGLEPDPVDDVIQEYRNPLTGGPAMTTFGMRLQRLRAGFQGQARRHTGSKLYYVVSGSGTTVVDDIAYDWNAGDFLTVKPWAWHAHSNRSDSDAVLFQVSDVPAMRALGFYREETRTSNA
ncbi:MAG: cupin domain-containing protein [Pseudomonadota bacterium]